MSEFTRRTFLKAVGASAAILKFGGASHAANPADPLEFLVVGDWGKPDRVADATKVARQMGDTASARGCRFVISTGDNFYPQGVASVDDPKWRSAYEDVYSAASLQCPWYAVLGNHDYDGNVQAEIDYASTSPRWRMPSRHYLWTEMLADGNSADFFFIDTTPIARLSWFNQWLWADSEVQFQLEWLEQSLATSHARWKFVIGHHPVYSGGHHGNTSTMIEMVKPLLDRYGVQAYLNGHDHDLQHIVVDNVHYLTSGSGSSVRETAATGGTLFARAALGFMSARLTPDTLEIAFIDEAGNNLHSATISGVE